MDRRDFLQTLMALSAASVLGACKTPVAIRRTGLEGQVMTVNGPIGAGEMGMTLTHEHLFADVRPYAEQISDPLPRDFDEIVEVVLPYLRRIRTLGCRTLVDCTATGLGRDPALIKRLSDESGLQMLTVTGSYSAAGEQFLPPHVYSDSVEALAERWINEWEHGIGDTGIRPGLIKIAFGSGPLTDIEEKLTRAAAITHRETGLVIGSHTGVWGDVVPGENATSAFEQLALLEEAGVDPSAWIWIHAHNEPRASQRLSAARRHAWISLDGFRSDNVGDYVQMIEQFRDRDLLHRLLISQDAGWYTAGEPGGGDFTPFHPVFTVLIPALRDAGYTEADIDTLFVRNPATAFAIGVRS